MPSKSFWFLSCLFLKVILLDIGDARCPQIALASFPFVLEYAMWRDWHQAHIYTLDLDPGCRWAILRLVKCLGLNGVATTVDSYNKPRVISHLGVVVLFSRYDDNSSEIFKNKIKQLHNFGMVYPWFDWVITGTSPHDVKTINKVLNETDIRFDENIVGAFPVYEQKIANEKLDLCDYNFKYRLKSRAYNHTSWERNGRRICHNGSKYYNCSKTETEYGYYHRSQRLKNLIRNRTYWSANSDVALLGSGIFQFNKSRNFIMTNASHLSLSDHTIKERRELNKMYMIQYFKVRINSTLYGTLLGTWDRKNSMSQVEQPYPLEVRKFLGEELKFGRCNTTGESTDLQEEEQALTPLLLDDVLYFLSMRLNTTPVMRFFNKLGFRTYEGTWTGLLGALIDDSIDLALEPVISHTLRHRDMDYIFPIAETMFNIYIRDQESSAVRDIFLAPFSPRLFLCVFAIALVSATLILIISRFTSIMTNVMPMGFSEAFIWSTGVLCQQGGPQTPSNPAASILLLVCLLFALVIYNSYAAFITSVLSVRVASVDTVAAVLQSTDLKIGYIRNGPDQMYLMSTKDVQLNAFYIRGYSEAENLVSNAEEGLLRAAMHDYAFFSEQRAARSTLRSLSQERGRCSLRELAVPSTKAQLAFPLPTGSPYARPILISLLQLRGNGVLSRLEAVLVPSMPICAPPPRFASARATDVRSAFILFVIGLITSMLVGAGEYCWKSRYQLKKCIVEYSERLQIIFN